MDRRLAMNGVELIRQHAKKTNAVQETAAMQEADAKRELDASAVAALTELLQATMVSDDLSDRDYNDIFGEHESIDFGLEAIEILAAHDVVDSVAKIAVFVDYLFTHFEADDLHDAIIDAVAMFGTDGILSVLNQAISKESNETARCVLLEAVKKWGEEQDKVPESVQQMIGKGLKESDKLPVLVNSHLMLLVIDWKLKGFGELLERAFSSNRIDCGMAGDWDAVRQMLGVEGLGLPMPERPYNSMIEFRKKVGVGVFSTKPLFLQGEIEEDAVGDYLENAMVAFSESDEGQQLQDADHRIGYAYQFLEFGVTYLTATVDSMTVSDAREILLDVFPRKCSMKAEHSEEVIDELCAFWHFVDRIYKLEFAKEIEQEISRLAGKFRQAMSDPANFGMAKSLFMSGEAAGFDMTNQVEMLKFAALHNARMAASQSAASENHSSSIRVDQPSSESVAGMSLKKRKQLLAKKNRK